MYNLRLKYPKEDPMNLTSKLLMNSLYGRFGMNTNHSLVQFMDELKYSKFLTNTDKNISILDIEQFKLDFNSNSNSNSIKYLVEYSKDVNMKRINSNFIINNSSIAIAAAITAEARIFMSIFKNNPHIKLYYSDTDSIFINLNPDQLNELFKEKFPQGIVSNKGLGLLKLENVINKAIFLAPKCYWLELADGTRKVKIKGVKSSFIQKAIDEEILTFETFKSMLNKDNSLVLNQEKWARKYIDANITILQTSYELKQNDNKRELIYDDNGLCINTKPITINNPLLY